MLPAGAQLAHVRPKPRPLNPDTCDGAVPALDACLPRTMGMPGDMGRWVSATVMDIYIGALRVRAHAQCLRPALARECFCLFFCSACVLAGRAWEPPMRAASIELKVLRAQAMVRPAEFPPNPNPEHPTSGLRTGGVVGHAHLLQRAPVLAG